MNLMDVFEKLSKDFGEQKWWPIKRDFRPKEWEICVGAILTQNTNWRNVEKALENLKSERILSPEDVSKTKKRTLEKLIKPSGFYRQKAERLRELAEFVLGFGNFENFQRNVKRDDLLQVKGIGFETADSILLYACNRAYFVIDAYTKRLIRALGFDKKFKLKMEYESLRRHFEENLPKDPELYKEFHALIVEWGKRKTSSLSDKDK